MSNKTDVITIRTEPGLKAALVRLHGKNLSDVIRGVLSSMLSGVEYDIPESPPLGAPKVERQVPNRKIDPAPKYTTGVMELNDIVGSDGTVYHGVKKGPTKVTPKAGKVKARYGSAADLAKSPETPAKRLPGCGSEKLHLSGMCNCP